MPLIAEQIDRIQTFIQDTNQDAWIRAQVLTQHQDEMDRLARERRFGAILQIRGVADQALYTLPDGSLVPAMVLYNGKRLDYATEEFLDRRERLWEWGTSQEPKYWTTNNQDPEELRIVPAPSRTGSIAPQIPPTPFVQLYEDNLVIFLYRDLSDDANDESDTLPLLDLWEDILVWRTAAELAQRETPYQNLPIARIARAMADVWLDALE